MGSNSEVNLLIWIFEYLFSYFLHSGFVGILLGVVAASLMNMNRHFLLSRVYITI